jgi:NADH dehydrogenase FAD-containing subunit
VYFDKKLRREIKINDSLKNDCSCVIAGAGLIGLEMAGALEEIQKQ